MKALRYAHFINYEEQSKLFAEANILLIDSFQADGKSTNLNRYVILKSKSL
jgi:hypothetical protein